MDGAGVYRLERNALHRPMVRGTGTPQDFRSRARCALDTGKQEKRRTAQQKEWDKGRNTSCSGVDLRTILPHHHAGARRLHQVPAKQGKRKIGYSGKADRYKYLLRNRCRNICRHQGKTDGIRKPEPEAGRHPHPGRRRNLHNQGSHSHAKCRSQGSQ